MLLFSAGEAEYRANEEIAPPPRSVLSGIFEPRFSQINVPLDPAEGFVVNHPVVPEFNDDLPLSLQAIKGQLLIILRKEMFRATILFLVGFLELTYAVFILDAQAA